MLYEIKNNEQYKSTEILFDGKPSEQIRNVLKAAGYRWHGLRRIWYGYKSAEEIGAILQNAENSESSEKLTETPKKQPKSKKTLAPLWDRTRTDDLPGYGTPENYLRKEAQKEIQKAKTAGGKYCGYDKAVAIVIRRILRERFPEAKFSVTSGGAGYLNAVDIDIKASPYGRNFIKGNPNAADFDDRRDRTENSPQLNAILNYCKALHASFDADDGDHYADYGAHHDLYGSASIDWQYTQTEPTKEQKDDIKAFEKSAQEQKEKEHAEFLERCRLEEIEREKQEKKAEERRKIEEQQAAEIMSSVKIVDLEESEQIAALDFITGCGKEGSIKELKEVIEDYKKDGEEINANDLIISRKVIFNDRRIFENFSALLWRDWEFLAGKGCTELEDERLKNVDYYKLTREQRETVKTFSADCVGVYLNDCLQYVIDPQGYTYARYTYIPRPVDFTTENEEHITAVIKLQPATEYRAERKAESENKKAFYIPAPLSEQAEHAALKENEPITIISLDDMIITTRETRGYIVDVTPKQYAQYKDALRVVFNIKGKRGEYTEYLHNGKESIIYRGHLPEIPESLQYTDIGGGLKSVNYSGMSASGYIKRVVEWYEQQGFKPVIDTVAR